jgi:hypothetical protein
MNTSSIDMRGSWWRRQWLWLLGALVFGTWALYGSYSAMWEHSAESELKHPINVPHGTWAHYEGARWRLLELRQASDGKVPDIGMHLVARFELIPDAGSTAKKLLHCYLSLSDENGRRWKDDPLLLGTFVHHDLPINCGIGSGKAPDFKDIEATPGVPWQFETDFVVPRTLELQQLHPEVRYDQPEFERSQHSPPGTYLHFDI